MAVMRQSLLQPAARSGGPQPAAVLNQAISTALAGRSLSHQTGFEADQYAVIAAWAFLTGRKGTRAVAASAVMYSNFKSGAVWDAKPYLAERFGYTASDPDRSWVPTGGGAKIRVDAFGNINYAVMLASYGVTEDVALAASHAPGADVGYGGASTYDDAAISLGYQLASTYPDGFSESTYTEFILENLDTLK